MLSHPAYNPDLALSDYHVFGAIDHFLYGQRLNNEAEVENGWRALSASKPNNWLRDVIKRLV